MSLFSPIVYGASLFRLEADDISENARSVHTVKQRWQTASRTQFAMGDAPEGWENMRIVGIDPREEVPGRAWDIRLDCEGILDSRTWLELDRVDAEPMEGWDTIALSIFTRDVTATRWARGAQIQADALTSVTATASTDVLAKTAHGLATAQMIYISFSSGFGGLTSGNAYYVIRLDADTFKLATTAANASGGTAINISSDGTGGTVTPVVVGYENLFITDRTKRVHRAKDYYILDLELKGLASTKPAVRRMNSSASSFASKFDGYTLVIASEYAGMPPTATGGTASMGGEDLLIEYNSPEPTITDTLVTTTFPDPNWINLFWTPENAPTISFWSASGVKYTYNIPWGWSLANMATEQIPGKNVWLATLTWIYRRAARPSAPAA